MARTKSSMPIALDVASAPEAYREFVQLETEIKV